MGEARRRNQLGLPLRINIEWEKLEDRVCPKCGGKYFRQDVLVLKTIPKLLSKTGMLETAMQPAGFICIACGTVIPVRPKETEEPREAEKNIILTEGGHS
jgi:hypothetical protein